MITWDQATEGAILKFNEIIKVFGKPSTTLTMVPDTGEKNMSYFFFGPNQGNNELVNASDEITVVTKPTSMERRGKVIKIKRDDGKQFVCAWDDIRVNTSLLKVGIPCSTPIHKKGSLSPTGLRYTQTGKLQLSKNSNLTFAQFVSMNTTLSINCAGQIDNTEFKDGITYPMTLELMNGKRIGIFPSEIKGYLLDDQMQEFVDYMRSDEKRLKNVNLRTVINWGLK